MTDLKKIVLTGLVFLITFSISVSAQKGDSQKFSVIDDKDDRVTIPFQLINNLIVVKLEINESEPLTFIIDSGAGRNIITSLYDKEITLNNVAKVRLAGLGKGNSLTAYQSLDNKIRIGNRIEGNDLEILLLEEELLSLSSFMGIPIHGILGYDFFSSFAVEVNYRRNLLRIYDHNEFVEKFETLPEHRKWYTLPIKIEDKKAYLNAKYKPQTGQEFKPLQLLLDTGASNSFSLYEVADEYISVPNDNVNAILGTGLSGFITGQLGRVHTMRLGEFEFVNPIVAFPDSQSVRRAIKLDDRKGSIGGDIFRRFKVIFHYENEKLYVRKNGDFDDEFHFNASGLEVSAPYPELRYYVVSYVREGSPGDSIGIKEGDVLLQVNNKSVTELTLNELFNYLQNKKGDRVYLKIKRDSLNHQMMLEMGDELKPLNIK